MFIVKTAFKYLFSKSKGQKNSTVISIIGIALSIMAVIVVSSVMNGLQDDQLDSLRQIESYDLIIENTSLLPENLKNINGVDFAFKYYDTAVLINNKSNGQSTISKLRAIDLSYFNSNYFNDNFSTIAKDYFFEQGVLISYSMLNDINYTSGDNLVFTVLQKGKTASLSPKNIAIKEIGVFGSKLQSFNTSTVLMNINYANNLINTDSYNIGIFSQDVKNVEKQILLMDPDAEIITWQEYNQINYSALMLEKALVYMFLCLLFIILGVNLKNNISRFINIKTKECGILRAVGLEKKQVTQIFLLQGTFITLFGEILGVLMGFLFVRNIEGIFSFADFFSYFLIGTSSNLSQLSFYALIKPIEIIIMIITVFILSLVFTLLGCRKLFKSEIMEEILNVSY